MTAASGIYPLPGLVLADRASPPPAAAPALVDLDLEESAAIGVTPWVSPPPPGVSTSLVMLCTLGCLLAVVLVVRGEALLMELLSLWG